MFNAISRQACRHALLQDNTLQPLLPFFDLLYHQHNRCWYQTPQGTYQQFPQEEGFTQGCPLSGAFADIVLTQVLQPLNQQLQQRIRLRSPTAIPPTTLSYHDDTSIVLPYPDLEWFITQFQALGNPLGICLNLSKTQLLTSLTSDPPTLSTEDQHHRLHFLQLLGTKVEHYQGLRLLGQPIGSRSFATTYIAEQAANLHHIITQQLFHRIHNHQTQLAILKYCALPSIFHLLATHLYHSHHDSLPTTIFHWDSDITLSLRITIHHALALITQQTTLPQHTYPLLHLPATLGGLGLRDPIVATIPAYITTVTRSIRYAEHGISLHTSSPTAMAPIHKHVLTQDRYYQILQHYAPSFLPLVPHPQTSVSHLPLSFDHFLQNTDMHGLQ
jgi:hypothetical protein